MIQQQLQDIAQVLGKIPFILNDEKKLQAEIDIVLQQKLPAYVFAREHKLSNGTVDFFSPIYGIAIEVKIKGSAMAIYRQLKKYAQDDSTKAIVLISSTGMTLPAIIEGKPTIIINPNKAWL